MEFEHIPSQNAGIDAEKTLSIDDLRLHQLQPGYVIPIPASYADHTQNIRMMVYRHNKRNGSKLRVVTKDGVTYIVRPASDTVPMVPSGPVRPEDRIESMVQQLIATTPQKPLVINDYKGDVMDTLKLWRQAADIADQRVPGRCFLANANVTGEIMAGCLR